MMKSSFVFFVSLALSLLLTPLVRLLAFRFKLLDYPNKRKVHKIPVPRLGGIAIALAFYATFLMVPNAPHMAKGTLIGGLLVLFIGILDDIMGVPASIRFCFQILAVSVLLLVGTRISFLPDTLWGSILGALITVIWVVGITNAINFLDGLDGLAAGLAIIASVSFYCITFFTDQYIVKIITSILAGCCLGFLPFNISRLKIFLGDSGSTFLGFVLATMALKGSWAKNNIVAIAVPILVLGVPIFDMVFTTLMRAVTGKVHNIKEWMEYAGKDHFHHSLVDIGLDTKGSVLFICAVAILLGLSAIVLGESTWVDAVLLLVQGFIVFVLLAVLMIVGKRRKSGWQRE